jgi:hypothetical protein
MIEDFFICHPGVNDTGVLLELLISLRTFEKIRNGTNGIFRGLGETDL